MGKIKAKIIHGERARVLSPVVFRARMRQEEEERQRQEASEKTIQASAPRRSSRNFGSHSPIVF